VDTHDCKPSRFNGFPHITARQKPLKRLSPFLAGSIPWLKPGADEMISGRNKWTPLFARRKSVGS
jgi:hypothetical protein